MVIAGSNPVTLRILSWNVNGLGSKLKRGVVRRYVARRDPDLILLQERHLVGNNCGFLGQVKYKMLIHTGFTTGCRGVDILARTSPPFQVSEKWVDKKGCYAGLRGGGIERLSW